MGLLESNEMKRKALILKPRCGFFCWEGSFSASLIRMFGLFFNLAKTLQCLLCLQRKRESNRPKKRGGTASLFLSAWRFIECHAASVWQEMLGVMAGFWRWLGQLLKVLEQTEIIAYDGLMFLSALHHQHASLSLSLHPLLPPVIYWSPHEPYIMVGLKAVHSLWTFCLKDQQQLAIQHPALCNETIRFRLVSCAHLHSLAWRTKRSRAGSSLEQYVWHLLQLSILRGGSRFLIGLRRLTCHINEKQHSDWSQPAERDAHRSASTFSLKDKLDK